jgi:hypothetical protein
METSFLNIVLMEDYISVGNCQGNSLSVEEGPGESKKSSWFSKLKNQSEREWS